jgi:hypothetical protein
VQAYDLSRSLIDTAFGGPNFLRRTAFAAWFVASVPGAGSTFRDFRSLNCSPDVLARQGIHARERSYVRELVTAFMVGIRWCASPPQGD